ncbi:hypothetical protein EJ05DRAFT_524154 [Pseudovirgaria hyperparasitica]|uniref:Extracelular serine carboxypeptidase n=1 Tax=Pseudovirgaria hyperparasitica TaxID=470096 RepID=A0A6A6WFS0_9PEZI|nr:uncharacterized protein EJ05DRAFT_524154 [Pseudovirgaria hyperparasitica]KAF2760904.1 hypothetical protein EJ05DRAFT_524154 [Pseudovirgaria hyperparasitica]
MLTAGMGLASLVSGAAEPIRYVAPQVAARQNFPAVYKAYTFDQTIDHFPNSKRYEPHANGTFQQRYFFDSSYYKPGGPVFLYIGGETSGESRLSNLQTGIIQVLMQQFDGLGVILENRYYGGSNGGSYPFETSTVDELAYLTTEQTIADNVNFARHATFPGVNATVTAPSTPWILYGGSLAGAQTAFSVQTYGDILYGGIASSATTNAVLGYAQWYDPIQKYGPQDCIARINKLVDNIDHVLFSNNTAAITQLKQTFGLEALKDSRDFAMTIAFPLGGPMFYPTNTWQELNWYTDYTSDDFFQFCGNVTDLDTPEDVTAVDSVLAAYTGGEDWKGLGNYAEYVKNVIVPLCEDGDLNNQKCFGTQNSTAWAEIANSGDRSYLYTSCTEQGAFIAAPTHGKSLISRVLQPSYTQQWCEWSFEPGQYNRIPKTPDLAKYNKYGGYDVEADRLAHIDGDQDVWLDLCYHSNNAPKRYSSDLRPEYLITGAGHHWDSSGIKDVGAEPQFIREAHRWEIRTVKRWLSDFDSWKSTKHSEL